VIFGEQNRGNVYNLLRQFTDGKFLMIGKGTNVKSMAYVENATAFIEYNLNNIPGEHLFNYIDKPDFDMNTLVVFDLLAKILHRKLPISSIRVKKFCANTLFDSTNIKTTDFKAPVRLVEGLERTITYEFINKTVHQVFYTE
jgi:hypothetical protein